MKRVLLFSGGMDSLVAWHQLGQPQRVYVRIGAPYEARELESIGRRGLKDGLLVLDAGRWLGKTANADGRVPLRNLTFALAAAAHTGADEVVLGALAGETSPDKSRRFARLASAAMTASEGRRIRLALPFRGTTKTQLVALGLRSVGPVALASAPSCYASVLPKGVAGCGTCSSCLRRWVAMTLNGLEERYMADPTAQARLSPTGAWWGYMARTPVRDWVGVARCNAELLLALRRHRRRM